MRFAQITGVGSYAPEKIVKNSYFDELYKKDVSSFLESRRNIFERRFMAENEATSDLIVPAIEEALAAAKVSKSDVDLLIVATDTPDYLSPSTASVVQNKMGLSGAGAFDVNSACAGFVTALDMATKYMSDPHYQTVVVVGAYGMTKYLNWDDYKIASLFADGAGAVVLQSVGKAPSFLASTLYCDGQYHDYMGIYAGGTKTPVSHAVIERREHLLNFAKKIPLETNTTHWPRLTHLLLERIKRTPSEIDHFFLTQINIESIHQTLDLLGVERTKSHNIMDRFGYTGSACIPMALADAVKGQRVKSGDLVFMLGSGGGVSMAALALEWA